MNLSCKQSTGYGLFHFWRFKSKESLSDFFLCDRKMPWWSSLLTVFLFTKLWTRLDVSTDIEFYELRYFGTNF